jgi:hypothetical protein
MVCGFPLTRFYWADMQSQRFTPLAPRIRRVIQEQCERHGQQPDFFNGTGAARENYHGGLVLTVTP